MSEDAITGVGAARSTIMGRPRSGGAHHAMLDAALAALTEDGPAGVTVQAICARSGCSRATFYRRWSTAWDCIAEATHWRFRSVDLDFQDDDLRETLIRLTFDTYKAFSDPLIRTLYGVWFLERESHPEFMDEIKVRNRDRRQETRTWLAARLAAEGASLRLSNDAVIDMLNGIAMNAALNNRDLERAEIENFLELVVIEAAMSAADLSAGS